MWGPKRAQHISPSIRFGQKKHRVYTTSAVIIRYISCWQHVQKQNSKQLGSLQVEHEGTGRAEMLPEFSAHTEMWLCLFASNAPLVCTGPRPVGRAVKHAFCFWPRSHRYKHCSWLLGVLFVVWCCNRCQSVSLMQEKSLKFTQKLDSTRQKFHYIALLASRVPVIHYIFLNNWHWHIFLSLSLISCTTYQPACYFYV